MLFVFGQCRLALVSCGRQVYPFGPGKKSYNLCRTFLKQAAVGLIFCPDQEKRTQNADDEQNLKSKLESEENGQESDLPLPPPPLQGRKSVKQKDNHIILGKRLKGT